MFTSLNCVTTYVHQYIWSSLFQLSNGLPYLEQRWNTVKWWKYEYFCQQNANKNVVCKSIDILCFVCNVSSQRRCCPKAKEAPVTSSITDYRQMETFSALLALCAGNWPVPGQFPSQRPVTRSFDVFFDLRLNERLSKTITRLVIWGAIALIMTSL